MHPDIKELIELAVADGKVTEKQREIVFRKADNLGEDKDEVEMFLEGKLSLQIREISKNNNSEQHTEKDGVLKRCPSCGSPIQSYITSCIDCGYEFQERETLKSSQNLFDLIHHAEQEERAKPQENISIWLGGATASAMNTEVAIANRLSNIIATFPLPNTKSDILEFLSQAVPLANNKPKQQKINLLKIPFSPAEKAQIQLSETWKAKAEQVVIKARFSFKNDHETLDQVELFAKRIVV